MLQSLAVGALLVFSWQTVWADVYEATVSIATAPHLATGLAHANCEPLARHLSAWVLRSHFVGNEQDEMWKPGGRLAELLEYWRQSP